MRQPSTMCAMRRTSFEDVNCSLAQCLEVIGDWWTLLIVRDVFLGATRFDDIQARLGISRNVLGQRRDKLVEAGVRRRAPYQEHPPRFDYRLTEKGVDLWGIITMMRQWGDRWAAPDGPRIELVHATGCGRVMDAELVCSECGERVGPHDVRAVPGPADPDGALLAHRPAR